jgi:hypothetical protein
VQSQVVEVNSGLFILCIIIRSSRSYAGLEIPRIWPLIQTSSHVFRQVGIYLKSDFARACLFARKKRKRAAGFVSSSLRLPEGQPLANFGIRPTRRHYCPIGYTVVLALYWLLQGQWGE